MKPGAMDWIRRRVGALAALCAVLAAWGFGAALEGYSHAQHPLSLLVDACFRLVRYCRG